MVKVFWINLVLLCTIFSLVGCQQEPVKSDSMIFRENTITQAQVPLDKAMLLLTEQVRKEPLDHLDSLIIINQGLRSARDVYAKNNIGNYQDDKLIAMENFVESLDSDLVTNAKSLLHQVVDKTLNLRTQIEDAKNQPFSARSNDTGQLVDYLGKQYNEDVKSCCLTQLSHIDQLLKSKSREHRDLLILIRSINQELGKVIEDKAYARELKQRIQASL